MKVNRYIWVETDTEDRTLLLTRGRNKAANVDDIARRIIEDVKERGDLALVDYASSLDGVELDIDALQVSETEFEQAFNVVSPELLLALQIAHRNIDNHHREQLSLRDWMKETSLGVISGERVTPIASVGLYVPRGKGSFPSVMLMLCTPATIAGVPSIAVCTPPGPDGQIDAASLVAARLCGIDTVYKVGGAQAVAAFAYGTQTIRRVDKIVGPGNQYVGAAKRLLYGIIDPGPPAGPSESVILADRSADAEIVAREWLVEAEHGPDSAAILVTESVAIANSTETIAVQLAELLPEPRRSFVQEALTGNGGIVVTDDLNGSIAFVNEYAPEHLRVLTEEPFEVLPKILHAGEVLLGPHSSIALGNFSIGLNAILPTGGTARSHSSVGVHTFVKFSSFAYVSREGARDIAPIALEFAKWEGFPAHEAATQFVLDRANHEDSVQAK